MSPPNTIKIHMGRKTGMFSICFPTMLLMLRNSNVQRWNQGLLPGKNRICRDMKAPSLSALHEQRLFCGFWPHPIIKNIIMSSNTFSDTYCIQIRPSSSFSIHNKLLNYSEQDFYRQGFCTKCTNITNVKLLEELADYKYSIGFHSEHWLFLRCVCVCVCLTCFFSVVDKH